MKLQQFVLIKSDVKAVASDESLYLSPAYALSTALSYVPDTVTPFLHTIAGGNIEEQTSSTGQALMQCMRAKDVRLHCILTLLFKYTINLVQDF